MNDTPDSSQSQTSNSWMAGIDRWAAAHPFHVRVLPLIAYVAFIPLIGLARDLHESGIGHPIAYVLQCGIAGYLIYRYRKLMPELNLKFHFIAIPVGIASAYLWIVLGQWMGELNPERWGEPGMDFFEEMNESVAWVSFILRLIGMTIIVGMVEEVFFRSALMRGLHRPIPTRDALVQILTDVPVLGSYLLNSKTIRKIDKQRNLLLNEFNNNPLGVISLFNLIIVGIIWSILSHGIRDWPGTIVCAFTFGFVVYWTNRGDKKLGLGPAVWTHAITNAGLWAYTIYADDWRFL